MLQFTQSLHTNFCSSCKPSPHLLLLNSRINTTHFALHTCALHTMKSRKHEKNKKIQKLSSLLTTSFCEKHHNLAPNSIHPKSRCKIQSPVTLILFAKFCTICLQFGPIYQGNMGLKRHVYFTLLYGQLYYMLDVINIGRCSNWGCGLRCSKCPKGTIKCLV